MRISQITVFSMVFMTLISAMAHAEPDSSAKVEAAFTALATSESANYRVHRSRYRDIRSAINAADKAGEEPLRIAIWWRRYAEKAALYSATQRYAKSAIKDAIRIHEDEGIPDPVEYGVALFELGKRYLNRKPGKSIELFKASLAQIEPNLSPNHPSRLVVLEFLEQARARKGGTEERIKKADKTTAYARPTPVYRAQQRYPSIALMYRVGAWVDVGFTIDASGNVKEVEILDMHMDRVKTGKHASTQRGQIRRQFKLEALRAVNGYRFNPSIQDGEYVDAPSQTIRLEWVIQR